MTWYAVCWCIITGHKGYCSDYIQLCNPAHRWPFTVCFMYSSVFRQRSPTWSLRRCTQNSLLIRIVSGQFSADVHLGCISVSLSHNYKKHHYLNSKGLKRMGRHDEPRGKSSAARINELFSSLLWPHSCIMSPPFFFFFFKVKWSEWRRRRGSAGVTKFCKLKKRVL